MPDVPITKRHNVAAGDAAATKKEERTMPTTLVGTKKEEKSRPLPDRNMFTGVLGAAVDLLDPTTEADPVAILASLLAGVGAMVTARPHLQVGNTRHPLLIWPLIFGRTSTGRKGESWSTARRVLAAADAEFVAENLESGLSSGEGLIERIKDIDAEDAPTRKGEFAGTNDKRLLVVEPEFGSLMARAKREGNTLAAVLRDAWDGRPLGVLTKSRSRASASHIAVIAHVAPKEFRIRQAEADLAGGSYNRFLPLFVERSKRIPIGEGIPTEALTDLTTELRCAISAARSISRITLDPDATALWSDALYDEFTEADDEDTPAAEFTRRGAPYCLRIAGLHAALGARRTVNTTDLTAAAALVRYAIESAHYVLGDTTGNPRIDRIRRALADAGDDGLSRTDISALFGRNLPRTALDELLAQVTEDPAFTATSKSTGGRPSTRYHHVSVPAPEVVSSFFVTENVEDIAS